MLGVLCCLLKLLHEFGWESRSNSVRLWQILKSEKRNDGVWYYRIHYNVRSSLLTVSPLYLFMPGGLYAGPLAHGLQLWDRAGTRCGTSGWSRTAWQSSRRSSRPWSSRRRATAAARASSAARPPRAAAGPRRAPRSTRVTTRTRTRTASPAARRRAASHSLAGMLPRGPMHLSYTLRPLGVFTSVLVIVRCSCVPWRTARFVMFCPG